MSLIRRVCLCGCLLLMCTTFSGCQLLMAPFQLVGGLFKLAGQALKVADGLPKPPPGVFF